MEQDKQGLSCQLYICSGCQNVVSFSKMSYWSCFRSDDNRLNIYHSRGLGLCFLLLKGTQWTTGQPLSSSPNGLFIQNITVLKNGYDISSFHSQDTQLGFKKCLCPSEVKEDLKLKDPCMHVTAQLLSYDYSRWGLFCFVSIKFQWVPKYSFQCKFISWCIHFKSFDLGETTFSPRRIALNECWKIFNLLLSSYSCW